MIQQFNALNEWMNELARRDANEIGGKANVKRKKGRIKGGCGDKFFIHNYTWLRNRHSECIIRTPLKRREGEGWGHSEWVSANCTLSDNLARKWIYLFFFLCFSWKIARCLIEMKSSRVCLLIVARAGARTQYTATMMMMILANFFFCFWRHYAFIFIHVFAMNRVYVRVPMQLLHFVINKITCIINFVSINFVRLLNP